MTTDKLTRDQNQMLCTTIRCMICDAIEQDQAACNDLDRITEIVKEGLQFGIDFKLIDPIGISSDDIVVWRASEQQPEQITINYWTTQNGTRHVSVMVVDFGAKEIRWQDRHSFEHLWNDV